MQFSLISVLLIHTHRFEESVLICCIDIHVSNVTDISIELLRLILVYVNL